MITCRTLRAAVLLCALACARGACPPELNAVVGQAVNGGANFFYCAYLAVRSCPHATPTGFPTMSYGSDTSPFLTYDTSPRTSGTLSAFFTGGSISFRFDFSYVDNSRDIPSYTAVARTITLTASDLTGTSFKLANNYPGTMFASTSSYNLGNGYYWDGPLAGGTGRITTTPPAGAAGATSIADSIRMCVSAAYLPPSGTSGTGPFTEVSNTFES